jgi:hypothetical protein
MNLEQLIRVTHFLKTREIADFVLWCSRNVFLFVWQRIVCDSCGHCWPCVVTLQNVGSVEELRETCATLLCVIFVRDSVTELIQPGTFEVHTFVVGVKCSFLSDFYRTYSLSINIDAMI